MEENRNCQAQHIDETSYLKSFVRSLGVDLVGVADLRLLEGMPSGLAFDLATFFQQYPYAVVLGIQLNKLGKKASGTDVNLFLEKTALDVMTYLEEKGYPSLIIHTEDEFDPVNRRGLLSLKVLAKGAGLGWQGRSLLIISPEYGPIHRWIAVLTNMAFFAYTLDLDGFRFWGLFCITPQNRVTAVFPEKLTFETPSVVAMPPFQ